jgi:hypothetical protein
MVVGVTRAVAEQVMCGGGTSQGTLLKLWGPLTMMEFLY